MPPDRISDKRFCGLTMRLPQPHRQRPGPHHGADLREQNRRGGGELCDDDDGSLLQSEAAGVFPEGRNRGLLAPEMMPEMGRHN